MATSRFLPIYVDNALEELAEVIPQFAAGDFGLDEALDFCRLYRTAGIGTLFLSGEPEQMHQFLAQSGRAFAHWLSRAPAEKKVNSLALPFFDAIAAGDLEGAREIARRSRRTWARGDEYEEDFLFVEYLMQRFFLGGQAKAIADLLDRWESALQGADDVRLAVCRALEARDARDFNESLTRFLLDREAEMEQDVRDEAVAQEFADTEASLSVEGVALVRLAESLGMAVKQDYPQVPSVAREGAATGITPESWKDV